MRQQRFAWAFLALAIVLTAYGGFSVVTSLTQNKGLSAMGLAFLIAGAVMLALFIFFLLASKRKRPAEPIAENPPKLAAEEEVIEEKPEEETKPIPEPEPEPEPAPEEDDEAFEPMPEDPKEDSEFIYAPRRSYAGTVYVSRVGYGPVLRVTGNEVLEMRSNTYYTIEGNYVKRNGGGPAFEISGNRIKSAYGSGLYEISGDSVSKTFGGYYASFSGNRLQTNDLREQYECTGSLNLRQKLTVVALLFGSY